MMKTKNVEWMNLIIPVKVIEHENQQWWFLLSKFILFHVWAFGYISYKLNKKVISN